MKATIVRLLYFGWIFIMCSCGTHMSLDKIIKSDSVLKAVAENPLHEVQIILTTVNKKEKTFHSQYYKVDDSTYFYPASVVKMPVAVLTLQRLNELSKTGINIKLDDAMITSAINDKLKNAIVDTTTSHRNPTIERYIQKLFAVSDNDAYNRLYEFLGPDYINKALSSKLPQSNTCIQSRLSIPGLTYRENMTINHIRFFRGREIIYDRLENLVMTHTPHNAKAPLRGLGYIDNNGALVNGPFDFRPKNFYPLRDMEATIQRVIFPDFFPEEQRFDLKNEDYTFLREAMSNPPSTYSFYAKDSTLTDSYAKFLLFGKNGKAIPKHIKIYNKIGQAYGYMIDCAYIENTKKDKGFFLTVVVYANKNMIFNDGIYEYEEVSYPFMAQLGKKVYKAVMKESFK